MWVIAGATLIFVASFLAMPFLNGEKVVYSMMYGPVPAGSGMLSVTIDPLYGDSLYHVRSVMGTNRFFSLFYRINDRVSAFFTPDSFISIRFAKSIKEGSHEERVSCNFLHDRGVVAYSDGDTVEMAPGAKDYLTTLYYVRSLGLTENEGIELINHTDKKNYELRVEVTGRETVHTPLGEFECLVADLVSESGGMFARGPLKVWFTNDEKRLPIQMETKMPIGSIRAVLRKLEYGGKED